MSRKAVKAALDEMPVNQVLLVKNSELTAKQREFARQVALGETGASAYRKSYNTTGKKKTQGDHASRLKADDRIKAEIEAYKLANAAAAYRSAEGLRDLVIHSLTQVLIDPDTPAAQKIQAAKVLGTVTEVAAFTERKIVSHVKDSEDIKTQIMSQLKTFLLTTDNVTDVDADQLLNELTLDDVAVQHDDSDQPDSQVYDHKRVSGDESEQGDPHPTPTPQNLNEPPPRHEHTIPHEPSISETTPMLFDNEDPQGDINYLYSEDR
jgi:hypothetical protein